MKNRWSQNFYWFNSSNVWYKEKLKYILDDDNNIFTIISGSTFIDSGSDDVLDCSNMVLSYSLGADMDIGNINYGLYKYDPILKELTKIKKRSFFLSPENFTVDIKYTFYKNKAWSIGFSLFVGSLTINEYDINFNPTYEETLSRIISIDIPLDPNILLLLLVGGSGSLYAVDDENLILAFSDFMHEAENKTYVFNINIKNDIGETTLLFEVESEILGSDLAAIIGDGYYNKLANTHIFPIMLSEYEAILVEFSNNGDIINFIKTIVPIKGFYKYSGDLYCYAMGVDQSIPNILKNYVYKITNEGLIFDKNIDTTVVSDDIVVEQSEIPIMPMGFNQHSNCINMSLPIQITNNKILLMSETDLLEYDENTNEFKYIYNYGEIIQNQPCMAFSNKLLWALGYDEELNEQFLNEYIINYDNEFTSVFNRKIYMGNDLYLESFFAKNNQELIYLSDSQLFSLIIGGDYIMPYPLFNVDDNVYLLSGYYNRTLDRYVLTLMYDENYKINEYSSDGDIITSIEINDSNDVIMGYFQKDNKLYAFTENEEQENKIYEVTGSGLVLITDDINLTGYTFSFHQNVGIIDIPLPSPPFDYKYLYSLGDFNEVNVDSTIWAWGMNNLGQLGINNNNEYYPNPKRVFGNHDFIKISKFYDSTLAIDRDGKTWAWGDNSRGDLGIGNNITLTPMEIYGNHTFVDIINNVKKIAIDKDGNLWHWGLNFINFTTPNRIPNHTFYSMSTMYDYSIGINNNNEVYMWGGYKYEYIYPYYKTPKKILDNIISITSNESKFFAIDQDYKIWSWGNNNGMFYEYDKYEEFIETPFNIASHYSFCQVLPKSNENEVYVFIDNDNMSWIWESSQTPIKIHGNHTFCEIFVNGGDSSIKFGIDNNNLTWAWGYNNHGALGINSETFNITTPTSVYGNHNFINIVGDLSKYMTIALDSDGIAWAWGTGNYLGLGDFIYTRTPMKISNHTFKSIYIINYSEPSIFGIDNNDNLWAWGSNRNCRLGINEVSNQSSPVLVYGGHSFSKLIPYYDDTVYALDTDNKLLMWGYDDIIGAYSTPIAVHGNHTFKEVERFYMGVLAADINDKLWAWGNDNYRGILGINSYDNVSTPVAVCGDHTFKDIFYNGIINAIDNNDYVWTWGLGYDISNGIDDTISTPIKLNSHSNIRCINEMNPNNQTTFFIDDIGLWGWGYNINGIAGNNSNKMTETPILVYGEHSFCDIYISKWSYVIFAKDVDGLCWGWGNSVENGGLGNNLYNVSTPILIASHICGCGIIPYTFNKIYNYYNIYAIDQNNELWAWGGGNYTGQLGNYSTNNNFLPQKVCGNHTICNIIFNEDYSFCLAIDNNGKGWAWGYNQDNNLGIGTYDDVCTPTAILGDHTFCQISSDSEYNLGLDNNDKLWIWGNSEYEEPLEIELVTLVLSGCNMAHIQTYNRDDDSMTFYAYDYINNKTYFINDESYCSLTSDKLITLNYELDETGINLYFNIYDLEYNPDLNYTYNKTINMHISGSINTFPIYINYFMKDNDTIILNYTNDDDEETIILEIDIDTEVSNVLFTINSSYIIGLGYYNSNNQTYIYSTQNIDDEFNLFEFTSSGDIEQTINYSIDDFGPILGFYQNENNLYGIGAGNLVLSITESGITFYDEISLENMIIRCVTNPGCMTISLPVISDFTITLDVQPDGSGIAYGEGTYNYGDYIELHAEPEPGYEFESWTDNGNPVSYDFSYYFNVYSDMHLVANFRILT